MSVTILEVVQNTPEWFEVRRSRATGSNADILLTKGLDQALKANLKSFTGNYFTQRGHTLEPEAIEIYELLNGNTVARPGFVVNDRFPEVGCSPDGICGEYLIEVKCFAEKRHTEIRRLKDIPFKIMAQLQFNMMICELKVAKLVMYNPDLDDNEAYREITVKANSRIAAQLQSKITVVPPIKGGAA